MKKKVETDAMVFICGPASQGIRCKCDQRADSACGYPLRGAKAGQTCSAPLCSRCAIPVMIDGRSVFMCLAHVQYLEADVAGGAAVNVETQRPTCNACVEYPDALTPCECNHAPCVHDENRKRTEQSVGFWRDRYESTKARCGELLDRAHAAEAQRDRVVATARAVVAKHGCPYQASGWGSVVVVDRPSCGECEICVLRRTLEGYR